MCMGGSSDAERILEESQKTREGLVRRGTDQVNRAFAGYTPEFYNRLQQNYLQSAMPEVANQYKASRDSLTYGLANSGLLRSSAAENLGSSLEQQLASNQRAVANQSIDAAQGLRRQVEQQKTQLLGQLQASTDPSAIASQAIAQASSMQTPSLYQPLGNMFQQWANIYGANKVGQAYAPQQTDAQQWGSFMKSYPPNQPPSAFYVKPGGR